MPPLLSLIDRLSRRRPLTVLLLLYAVVFGAILITIGQIAEATSGAGILDFERGYTPARVAELLGAYGPEGFELYQRVQILDLVNPALYSLVAACITHLIWRGIGPAWLALLPLLAGLGDYAENVTIALIIRAWPDVPDNLVAASSFLSLTKNGLMAVAFLPLVVGIVFWIVARLRR